MKVLHAVEVATVVQFAQVHLVYYNITVSDYAQDKHTHAHSFTYAYLVEEGIQHARAEGMASHKGRQEEVQQVVTTMRLKEEGWWKD